MPGGVRSAYAEMLEIRYSAARGPSAAPRGLHLPWEVTGVVDDDVPIATLQRSSSLAVAIADQRLDVGEQAWVALAAIEQRQLVAAGAQLAHEVRADEAGAARISTFSCFSPRACAEAAPAAAVQRPPPCISSVRVGSWRRPIRSLRSEPGLAARPGPGVTYCSSHLRLVSYQNSEFCGFSTQ